MIDPCEKKPVDTLASIGEQQREDITSSAQVQTLNIYCKAVEDVGMCWIRLILIYFGPFFIYIRPFYTETALVYY